MAEITTYLVLGFVILPPILRQAQRLMSAARSPRQSHASQPPHPRFFSAERLTPFASPFSTTVTIASICLALVSVRNLIPVQYGVDIFIPASAVQGLRRSISALYAIPTPLGSDGIEASPLRIGAFRGGYKPDLFLAYKAPITIPTTTLRNLISSAPWLLPVGYLSESKQAELQALIARLSSYEARRMYLLLGPRPLLDCTFCKTANDYFWYAVPFLFAAYAWRILAVGLITTHPDDSIAVAIRQAASLFSLSSHTSPPAPNSNGIAPAYEADRSGRRTSSLAVLLGSLAVELLIMFEVGQVSTQASRFNHWQTNLHILRQLVDLALVLVVYLFPARRITSSFEQSMRHLDETRQSLQNLMHVFELTDVTRNVVLQDQQLLDLARSSRSSSQGAPVAVGPHNAETIIQIARSHGGPPAEEAITQAQAGIRTVTRRWWHNAENINRQLYQGDSLPTVSSEASPQQAT